MVSASLLIQARRRAGLSQRALGERAGVSQQDVARYERGRVTPSLERLRSLIAACGLELTLGLTRADDSYDAQIMLALATDPARRLTRALADAQPLRAARAQARGEDPPAPCDAVGVLRALDEAAVRHVLVGELAEVLRGSPLLAITGSVTIVPQPGQRDALGAVVAAADGEPVAPGATAGIDAPLRWTLPRFAAELVVAPAPAATHGYEDLVRDAQPVRVADDLQVTVASLVDLLRIAQASDDGARVPALWRTLELATRPAAARAA